MQAKLDWIEEGTRVLGLAEYKGSANNPEIVRWLKDLHSTWLDDENAWCGTYLAHCLQASGFKRASSTSNGGVGQYPFHWYRALAYADGGGVKLSKPAYGCVAVKTRKGGGHVCFVVGRDKKSGKLVCLGGNQSDKVCYALYNESDFTAFMWYGKTTSPSPERYNLPILSGVTATKVSES